MFKYLFKYFAFLYYSSGYALPSISQNTSGQYNNQYPNGYRGSSSYPSLVNGSKNYNQPPAGKNLGTVSFTLGILYFNST